MSSESKFSERDKGILYDKF